MFKLNHSSFVFSKIKAVSFILAIIIALSGLVVLLGWAFHLEVLQSMWPGSTSMKANSAICFILVGLAIVLLHVRAVYRLQDIWLTRIARGLVSFVLLIAIITLVEYVFKINLGLDQLFFVEKANTPLGIFPGRMALNSAISFVFVAIAIFFVDATETLDEHISQILAFFAGFLSLVSIFGYLAGEKIFAGGVHGYNLMSVNTAVLFILTSLSVFLMQPNKSLTAAIIGNNPGGTLLRYTLLSFFVIICLLTWFIILCEKAGWFSPGFAIVLFSSAEVFVFILILWIISQKLNVIEFDALTKLRNRRSLFNILTQEINRALRYQRPLTALFIDIDDFKRYNDKYGHIAGDKVLIKLAELIAIELRQTDYSFRYGGEEFLILLPETSKEDAFSVAERLRNKFCAIDFSPAPHNQQVQQTVSIGLTAYLAKESPKQFVETADKAMYQAKNQGKNRVHTL